MIGALSTTLALSVLLLQPVPKTGADPVVGANLIAPAPAQLSVACDAFANSAERGSSSASLTRDLSVPAGGTFTITLCSNASTGFSWETPVFDAAAIAAVEHTAAGPGDAQLIGAAGTETWTFRMLGNAGGIDFAYSQPWSGGTKGAWKLHVNVTGSAAPATAERSVSCGENGAVTGLVRPDALAVRVGETFDVNLCSNPSTGFAWKRIDLSNTPLALVSHDMVPASGGLIGAAGTEKWTFKAVEAGQHALVFWYLRSWEGVPQLGVVWLNVNVTA